MSDDAAVVLQREIARLHDAAATADDPRLIALSIAASDDRVTETLERRLADECPYSGTLITVRDDRVHIVFSFARKAGQFGLVPRPLLAIVDTDEHRVTRVVDNYIAGPDRISRRPGVLRPDLDLGIWLFPPASDALRQVDGRQPNGNPYGGYWC
jgi:hypothetical protein